MNHQNLLSGHQAFLEAEKMPAGRKKTLKTAIQLFSKQGYHATSTAQIADAAGISQATIFKYFKTKEDLLIAVLQMLIPIAKKDFLIPLLSITDLDEIIHYIIHDRIEFFKANADLIKILLQEFVTDSPVTKLISQELTGSIVLLNNHLPLLKKQNPSLNQEIKVTEFVKIFFGPILIYFAQSYILNLPSSNEKADLDQIEKQVKLLLTTTS